MNMGNVNTVQDLVNVLSVLDCYADDFVTIKISNHTLDLFYETETDKFALFDGCFRTFETLDHMEKFIICWYFLGD